MSLDRVNLRVSIVAISTGADWNEDEFWFLNEGWNGLPYADFVEIQGLLLQVQQKLHQWGVEAAKAKADRAAAEAALAAVEATSKAGEA